MNSIKDNLSASVSLLGRYMRLVDISRDLASTLDLDSLLNVIVTAAADVTSCGAASILLYDETQKELYFQASTNINAPSMKGLVVPVEGSIAGEIITKRTPIMVKSVKDDPRHFEQVGETIEFETDSLLGVPLIAKDKAIGVLEVINKYDGDFTQEDKQLLTALGAQAAVAIENTRLFQQSDLIAEMIHEIRTPLASISTASNLLTRPEISQEQKITMAETIQRETARLSDLATTFLDLARLESGRTQFKFENVNLVSILNESVEIMNSRIIEHELFLILDFEDQLADILGDRDKLKQVAINLISNAVKYNRPNGSITVGARSGPKDTITFFVNDTGRGMLPEHVESLYDKFFRIPGSEQIAGGTGLGLSIVKKIVEGHGGTIKTTSELGVGTSFEVTLPLRQ